MTKAVLLLAALLIAFALPCSARAPKFHWAKIHVFHAPPSLVFARLGLTHSTRHGFGKDGYKKTDPDPSFPVGLTDVVPYNADRLLLVRGTDGGVTEFRHRVAVADAALQRWRVKAELFRGDDVLSGSAPLAAQTEQTVGDTPVSIAFSDISDAHSYQLTIHSAANNALSVDCRGGLSLPAKQSAPVFAPPMVWGTILSQVMHPGVATLFSDKDADRRAAQANLGITPDSSGGDFLLRVTIMAVS